MGINIPTLKWRGLCIFHSKDRRLCADMSVLTCESSNGLVEHFDHLATLSVR